MAICSTIFSSDFGPSDKICFQSSIITRWAQKMCFFLLILPSVKSISLRIQIIPTLLACPTIQKTWNWDLRNVYFEEKSVLQGQSSETTKLSLCKARSKISKLFGALLKSHNSWVAEKKTWQKLKGVCEREMELFIQGSNDDFREATVPSAGWQMGNSSHWEADNFFLTNWERAGFDLPLTYFQTTLEASNSTSWS